MSSGFEIDHESVERYGSQMRAHGEDYAAALQRLRERGLGGASWGDDGLLSMLVGPYAEASMMGLQAMTGQSMVMGDSGDGLTGTSATIQAADDAGGQQVSGVQDRWV
ncbi:hypothetical protein ACFLIM_13590 [Nonomuraea sp. M3C6]|uniref:Excreted virulence factor EspC, type VII ESX diderm n=1 Tax=Nonomuraea marmarensis TaxID=3351344 RepID=A0ABW7AA45_9ACTN